jgi:hypothetical protein
MLFIFFCLQNKIEIIIFRPERDGKSKWTLIMFAFCNDARLTLVIRGLFCL